MTKNDLWHDRFNWIWTFLFTVYTGLICGSLMHGAVENKGYTLLGDNMFLIFVPFLGFFFSRRSFRYLQEDSYTQMLAYMRRLPVPTVAILWNRIIQMLITFLINGLVFFSIIYLAGGKGLGLSGVLAFAVTWIAYGLFINALFIFWEFSTSGKRYFVLMMIMFVICIGGALVAAILDQNLIKITMQQSAAYGLLAPLMWGTLLVGAVSLAVSFKLTYKQLLKRDLS